LTGGLVVAGALAALGMTSESLKTFLFAFLAPGFVLMLTWLIAIIREPKWFRNSYLMSMAFFAGGGALFALAIVAWLPWMSTDAAYAEEMPLFLRIPLFAGMVFLAVGILSGAFIEKWQKSRTSRRH
jgi:hypothetical protein